MSIERCLSAAAALQVPSECNRRSERVEKADEAYFDSYGYFDIHRTMLEDKVGPSTQCYCSCPLL